jgi:hypothetical protein
MMEERAEYDRNRIFMGRDQHFLHHETIADLHEYSIKGCDLFLFFHQLTCRIDLDRIDSSDRISISCSTNAGLFLSPSRFEIYIGWEVAFTMPALIKVSIVTY